MLYTADFETTTDPEDCRVWAYGILDIETATQFHYGNSIDGFMYAVSKKVSSSFYFRNLKFDGEFILNWLFRNGWKHNPDGKHLNKNEFSTLISNKGLFYSIKLCYGKDRYVKFLDSLKIIPFSIEQTAKTFGLPVSKLKIDYDEYRPPNHKLTPQEIDYLKGDVTIDAMALKILFDQDLKQMTQGSNALHDFKKIMTTKEFERRFPILSYDEDIRQAYKGGFTYVNKKYIGKDVGQGIVLDVNSLYPWVMREKLLPYGEGKYFDGKYNPDKQYNLYVQMFTCRFKLKEGFIPTIQLKNNLAFVPTEYIESSGDEDVTLCLTNVDMELFFKHYDVDEGGIDWIGGWKFRSSNKLFRKYVDKWVNVKIKADKTGNKGLRTLAKLMLNSLYGKFGLNPNVQSKYPYLEDEIVKYKLGPKETRYPIYIPVAVFVTAWARYTTISAAQSVYDRFIYADTDSLHLEGLELPCNIKIHPTELGAWKHESTFHKSRFIRAKSYIEDEYINTFTIPELDLYGPTKIKITCAGMPKQCYKYVTWENFKPGTQYAGKLQQKHVKNGIVLKEIMFTIKE